VAHPDRAALLAEPLAEAIATTAVPRAGADLSCEAASAGPMVTTHLPASPARNVGARAR
jgi:hypothetical protein